MIGGSRSSGSVDWIVFGRPVTMPSRASSIPGDQVVERLHELVDPVVQQLLRDVAHVDPGVGEPFSSSDGSWSAVLPVTSSSSAQASSVFIGIVLTVSGPTSAVHVLGLGVVRVLHAGRRPQRALHRRPGLAQLREAIAVEQLLEAHVGGARVRDRRDPAQVLLAELRQPLVHLGVHARDEEARDRVHVERLARPPCAAPCRGCRPRRSSRRTRRENSSVTLTLMPAAMASSIAGTPSSVPGILTIRLGRSTRPQKSRACATVVSVSCASAGSTSSETKPSAPSRLVPDRPQHVAGQLDVEDRDLLEHLARRHALLGQLGDLLVVVLRAEDRLLEDRRVRGHAAQRELAHEPLELAGRDQAAADLVQPHARARGGQRREPFVLRLRRRSSSDSFQARADTRSTTARARSATFSGVKPKCS